MTITLFDVARETTGCPRWRGGLFICASFAITLGACAGSDSDDAIEDEPVDETPSTSMTPSAPRAIPMPPSTRSTTDEDGPDVTDIDVSTAPAGDSGDDDEPTGEADVEAAAGSMSMLPTGTLDVPDTDLCAAVAEWDPAWVQFEEEILLLVNEFRSQPADCGVEGQFAAADPLSMNPILRCSARLHSLDMFEREYFEHETPDGVTSAERMAAAGFEGSGGGENIAFGQRDPEEVMLDWMASDGHCANVMRASFDTLGVGYHPGSGMRGGNSNYWTQNFGAPPFMRDGS